MKKLVFLESTSIEALNAVNQYVSHFLCCFNTGDVALTTEYTPPYVTNINLNPSGISFTVVGVNPITEAAMELYEREVFITQNVFDDGIVKARVSFPENSYSYGSIKVYLSPCTVLFLDNNISINDTTVTIKTKTPLVTSFSPGTNKVTVSTVSGVNAALSLAEPDINNNGIAAVNGLRPQGGNIQLTGSGDTVVTVAAVGDE